MITIYEKKTGQPVRVEAVDAREILNSSDLYSTEATAKTKNADVDITQPSHEPRISDSGMPAGAEFTRRVLQEDQDLLRAQRNLEREGDATADAAAKAKAKGEKAPITK